MRSICFQFLYINMASADGWNWRFMLDNEHFVRWSERALVPRFYAVFFDHMWRPLYVANTYQGMLDMAENLKTQDQNLYCVVNSVSNQVVAAYTHVNVKYIVHDGGNFECLSRDLTLGLTDPQGLTELNYLVDEERDRLSSANPPLRVMLSFRYEDKLDFEIQDSHNFEQDRDLEASIDADIETHEFVRIYQIRHFTTTDTPLYMAITEREYDEKVRKEEAEFYAYMSENKDHAATDHVWEHIILPMLHTPMNYLIWDTFPHTRAPKKKRENRKRKR